MHEILYLHFDEKYDKRKIAADADQLAISNGDYHSPLGSPIRFMQEIAEDENEACELIKKNDKGFYDQIAVRYKTYKEGSTKTLAAMKENVKKIEDLYLTAKKQLVRDTSTAEFIGCPDCKSKLKREKLRMNSCPLCGADLRSKTMRDHVASLEEKANKAYARYKEAAKKCRKQTGVQWLVKIEYHV